MSKKGENIYKRKDKRWEARYIKSHGPDGRAQYGYCYGKTYREAKEKLADAKARWQRGEVSAPHRRETVGQYGVEWLQLQRSRVKPATFVKYGGMVEQHLLPALGTVPLRELTSVTVEQFSHTLLTEKQLSPKTVRDILTVLRSVLQYAGKGTLPIVYPKLQKREMRVLTREEQQRLVEFLLDGLDDCKFGVLLSLATGLRVGEICALQWGNISLDEGTLTVSATMQRLKNTEAAGGKTRILISDPKTETSARVIPLSPPLLSLCDQRAPHDPALFVLTRETDYMEPRTLQYRMERYTRECGLQGVHFHTLRHTFATRCVEAGFEIKSLSEVLGHANVQVTLDRYVHSSLQLKRDNMNKLDLLA